MASVLHIEDDPKNRLLVRKLLEKAGHEVVDAEGGLEGIRLAEHCDPDLVLVDIRIPDLDGYEVILRLRGIPSLARVPIVAITAEGDRDTSLAVGADGFIGKPIQARRFAKTIDKFLAGHREPRERVEDELRLQSQKIVERLEHKVRELSEANQRLEDMARLRREFLQNVSHELATPMTPVVGYLKLLIGEDLGPLTELQRKCLNSVSDSTQRLRLVVDTLLDVSSLETNQMHFFERSYDFCEVARGALKDVEGLLTQRGVEARTAIAASPMEATGDPEKLRRAMLHVLDNAIKFSPRGGVVAVEARRVGVFFELIVADSGPGIADENLPKVLEPFFQVDGSRTRMHGGVGLGLAFSRRVCEALGGQIEVVSPSPGLVAGEQLAGAQVMLRVGADGPKTGQQAVLADV